MIQGGVKLIVEAIRAGQKSIWNPSWLKLQVPHKWAYVTRKSLQTTEEATEAVSPRCLKKQIPSTGSLSVKRVCCDSSGD